MSVLGLIGGSGMLKTSLPVFGGLKRTSFHTSHGPAILHIGPIPGTTTTLVFAQRHAATPGAAYTQPADINYAAIALAMKAAGVSTAIGVCSVGSLHAERLPPGSILIPHDYFCPADLRPVFADSRGHFVPSFDASVRKNLLEALLTCGLRPVDGGVYVNSKGPRFETKSEIRFYATVGDVVGMTGAHEASALQEIGIPYAAMGMVDNMCNGLVNPTYAGDEPLSLGVFHKGQAENLSEVERAVDAALQHFAAVLSETPAEAESGAGAGAGAGAADASSRIPVDSLIHARYVIPVEPENTVLEHHSVAVKDGIIIDLLPTDEAVAKYVANAVTHLREHALIPGLINAHTHVSMNLLRGMADDLSLLDWLTKEMWPTEAKFVSPEFCAAGTRHAIAELIRSGCTTFNDMYFFPEATADAVIESGIRAALALVVFSFPTNWASNEDEYFTKGKAVLEKYRDTERLTFTVGPHAPYTVSDAAFERIQKWSEEESMKVHLHLHETAGECADSCSGTASMVKHQSTELCRPFANLDRLGLVNDRLVAVHMTQISDEEVARLAEARTSVVHCPSSNLKLGSGFCPVAKLESAGVNVALGTDSAASNNSLDMMAELKLAAILAKGVSGDTTAVPAHRALRMATLNGAIALGLQDKVGSIVIGKRADLTAVRLDELELSPVYNVISHLVYVATRDSVTDVWVDGARLLDCRRLTTLDESDVIEQSHKWAALASEFNTERRAAEADAAPTAAAE